MRLAILLTATVVPSCRGGIYTPEERVTMYHDTLSHYARTVGRSHPIVFLENSGYDLSGWKREFAQSLDVEWLQFGTNGGGNR